MTAPATAGLASTVAAVALALTACTPAGSSPGTGAPAVAGTTVTTSDGVTPLARSAGCNVHDGRADITCTPGATNPDVTPDTLANTICTPNWTATVRPPTAVTDALKTQQMADYHQAGPAADFEEDHLIALSAGGAPRDPSNLWPQPRSGTRSAAVKDAEENRVHRDICAGRLTLHDGQAQLLADWTHP